jgi:hypothetical protein
VSKPPTAQPKDDGKVPDNAVAKAPKSEEEDGAKPEETDTKVAANDAAQPEAPSGGGSGRGIDRANKLRPAGGDKAGADKPQPISAPALEIPGPFTDDEIKALSKAEAQALLGKISRARQLPTLDDDTKKRLKDDFNRVLQRAKDAQ